MPCLDVIFTTIKVNFIITQIHMKNSIELNYYTNLEQFLMPLFDDFVLGMICANASRVAALHVLAQK